MRTKENLKIFFEGASLYNFLHQLPGLLVQAGKAGDRIRNTCIFRETVLDY